MELQMVHLFSAWSQVMTLWGEDKSIRMATFGAWN